MGYGRGVEGQGVEFEIGSLDEFGVGSSFSLTSR